MPAEAGVQNGVTLGLSEALPSSRVGCRDYSISAGGGKCRKCILLLSFYEK